MNLGLRLAKCEFLVVVTLRIGPSAPLGGNSRGARLDAASEADQIRAAARALDVCGLETSVMRKIMPIIQAYELILNRLLRKICSAMLQAAWAC